MEANSVVDLESEVEELLLAWSSSTPKDNDIRPEGSRGRGTVPAVDSPPRTGDEAKRNTSRPSVLAPTQQVGQRHLQERVRLRDTVGRCHPYGGATRLPRLPSPSKTYKGSYVAELKAIWPARYWKLKDSMDRFRKLP